MCAKGFLLSISALTSTNPALHAPHSFLTRKNQHRYIYTHALSHTTTIIVIVVTTSTPAPSRDPPSKKPGRMLTWASCTDLLSADVIPAVRDLRQRAFYAPRRTKPRHAQTILETWAADPPLSIQHRQVFSRFSPLFSFFSFLLSLLSWINFPPRKEREGDN